MIVGFRANEITHKRILQWLDKAENRSEETRRLMELGMDVLEGKYQKVEGLPSRRFESKVSHLPWLNRQLKG